MCHVGTPPPYAERVSKSRYSPPTPEVAAEIEAVVNLRQKALALDAEYRERLTALLDAEGEWKVPVAHMAALLDLERKTVYRHTGRSMT
jgi:transcriptional regulator of acetoin/glycerol metabolism